MPRKRRKPKVRRLPVTLQEITPLERTQWNVYGPRFDVDNVPEVPGYTVWPDLATWAAVYGAMRADLFAARPYLRESSVADALYEAYLDGADLDTARASAQARCWRPDPRLQMFAEMGAH